MNSGNKGLYSTNIAAPPANQNLIQNGDFRAGFNHWMRWEGADWAIVNEVLHFKRAQGAQGGAVTQDLSYSPEPSTPFEIAIDLGNNSAVTKTPIIALRGLAGWDNAIQCSFTLPPNTPLRQYVIRGRTPATRWSSMRLELLPNPNDGQPDVLADNISVTARPGLSPGGTECIEEGRIRPPETACLKPLLRYYNDVTGRHFYTSNWSELRISSAGWRFERAEGYVPTNATCHPGATRELYRLYHDGWQKHFYTSSVSERDTAINNFGYRPDNISIVAYLPGSPTGAANTQPLYRAYHNGINNHFYTTSLDEYNAVIALGYQGEGIREYVIKGITQRARFDFNGDGHADILWRNASSGANSLWLINGSATTTSIARVTDLNWRVVGADDFNGDGRADILWRNGSTGANSLWLMNGSAATMTSITRVADLSWRVAGTGDFNGDGRADILWRNASSGANSLWLMNGPSATSFSIGRVSDLNWRVAGTGDFNGDGRADILWRNGSTGANSLWLMNGGAVTPASVARVADLNWRVVGTGDFNGDGRADILWRNASSGANSLWLMNGGAVSRSASLLSVNDTRWNIVQDGDFNGDGRADILWRNASTGANAIWLMSSESRVGSIGVSTVGDLNWQVVSAGSSGVSSPPATAPIDVLQSEGVGVGPVVEAAGEPMLALIETAAQPVTAPAEAGPEVASLAGPALAPEHTLYLPLLAR